MIKGTVAIIGRPNVGKSTIFNRMTRSRKSIVDDQPGVTRDRLYGVVESPDPNKDGFVIIDTGGFETKEICYQPFENNVVWEQTKIAIQEADIVLMVFDAKSGLHPHDAELVNFLKKHEKNVVYVANKVDGIELESTIWEFYELGIPEEILPCCAAHNRGVWPIVEKIAQRLKDLPARNEQPVKENALKIALIGRPNGGKSSILNRIYGESRAIVNEVAGTTRDSIDTLINYNGKSYVLIDTAGIRRRSKIDDKLESVSVMYSLKAIDNADIIVIVTSAPEGISDQDARLAALAVAKYKPILIVANKWDLIEQKTTNTAREYEQNIHLKLKDIAYAPVMFTSCLTNQRVHKIMSQIEKLSQIYERRVPTSDLNEALEKAVKRHTPALVKKYNKRVKFYYATQVRTCPPTFVIMCNIAHDIQESYKRYITKQFRQQLGFDHIPLNVIFRGKKEQNSRKHLDKVEIH